MDFWFFLIILAGLPEWSNGTRLGRVGLVPTQVRILCPAPFLFTLFKELFLGLSLRTCSKIRKVFLATPRFALSNPVLCTISFHFVQRIVFGLSLRTCSKIRKVFLATHRFALSNPVLCTISFHFVQRIVFGSQSSNMLKNTKCIFGNSSLCSE